MSDLKNQTRHHSTVLVLLCIVATLWNAPHPLYAAEALEVNRPFAAEGDLSVTIDKQHYSGSDMDAYIVTFKNLSDHEVAYEDLKISFPDNPTAPNVLSPAEVNHSFKEMEKENPEVYYRSHSGVYVPSHITVPSSGGGSCNDACAVIVVLLVVFFVIIIVGAIVAEAQKQDKIEKEILDREAAAAERLAENPKAPIQLLRYRETKRSIMIRKDPLNPVNTMKIEVLDKNQKTRTFKAEMGGKATT